MASVLRLTNEREELLDAAHSHQNQPCCWERHLRVSFFGSSATKSSLRAGHRGLSESTKKGSRAKPWEAEDEEYV